MSFDDFSKAKNYILFIFFVNNFNKDLLSPKNFDILFL